MTYPKCGLAPADALALLQALPIRAQIVDYIVAQELHQDGTPHLHVYLNYDKKVSFGPNRWDLSSFHGNYQPARSWKAVAGYCTKGANYISNFNLDAAAAKRASGRDLNKRLLEGDLTELVLEGEVPLEKYLRLKACKEAFFKDRQPVLPRCIGFIPNTLGHLFPVLSGKQRHYWIWSSKPNTGKTSFLRSVALAYPSYWYSYKESFQACHPGTQFILLDEYSVPHLQATQLNQMCDGTWMYPVKGANPVQLVDPIMLVAANKPPKEVYPNCHSLIIARFLVVEL